MQTRWRRLAMTASLLFVPVALGLAEFGIEGMGVVTTRADEARATISPDGRHIVREVSGREGGPGDHDLWQATLAGNRWIEPQPLPFDSAADETDAAWLGDSCGIVFARNSGNGSRLPVASCHGGHYDNAMALPLSFNDASGHPRGSGGVA